MIQIGKFFRFLFLFTLGLLLLPIYPLLKRRMKRNFGTNEKVQFGEEVIVVTKSEKEQ